MYIHLSYFEICLSWKMLQNQFPFGCKASESIVKGHAVFSFSALIFFFFYSLTEEELLMFDLQSLATLATARALELGVPEGGGMNSGRHFPARRIFNLRRKCSWAPRNEPVRPHLEHAQLEPSLRN